MHVYQCVSFSVQGVYLRVDKGMYICMRLV